MRSGTYRLMLKNEGYYDTSTQLIVGSEQSQTHPFDMRKLPGLVSIDTENVTGARVRIDGVDVGLTPLSDLSVEPEIISSLSAVIATWNMGFRLPLRAGPSASSSAPASSRHGRPVVHDNAFGCGRHH